MPEIHLEYYISSTLTQQRFKVNRALQTLTEAIGEITGDNPQTELIAKATKLDGFYAQRLPVDHQNYLKVTLRALKVAKETQETLDKWADSILAHLKTQVSQGIGCEFHVEVNAYSGAYKAHSDAARLSSYAAEVVQPTRP